MASGDAIQMLERIGNAMNDVVGVIGYPCYAAGCICAISALTMMAKHQEGSLGKGIMLLFIAGLFAGFPTFVANAGNSLLDISATGSSLSYNAGEVDGGVQEADAEKDETAKIKLAAGFAVSMILRVVGLVAVYKGLNRLKFYNMSPNGDPRLVSEAFTLIFMGTLTVFAKDFITMIANTVGGSFQTYVSQFLV